MGDMILDISVVVYVINLLSVPLLMAGGWWWNYTFRTQNTNPAFRLQKLKYGFFDRHDFDENDAAFAWFKFDGLAGLCLMLVLILLNQYVGVVGFVVMVGLLLALFLPRIFIDIGKALRYNHRTGNADRIDELQKQIEELRREQN